MSRYMTNDTGNCTEMWAGTEFYQDCLGETVNLAKKDEYRLQRG